MTDIDFTALVDESADGTCGPLLYAVLLDVTAKVVRRYPPAVYSPNRQARWDENAIREVAHECVISRMRPDQVRLLFGYARDLDALRALLGKRVRQTLLDLRVTDAVDNVLARVWKAVERRPDISGQAGFLLRSGAVARDATEAELASVAREVSLINQLREDPRERAPRVYGAEGVAAVADRVLAGLPGGVRHATLDAVLRRVLTHRTVTALVREETAAVLPAAHGDPAVEAEVDGHVDRALETLGAEDRTLVKQVFRGWTDTDVAKSRGYSRPSAHEARKTVAAKLRTVLGDADPGLADRIANRLYERLVHE